MSLNWYVIRLRPSGRLPLRGRSRDIPNPEDRLEFDVLHALAQREHPAMVPYETRWIKRPGKRFVTERRYPLFPSYVMSGFYNLEEFLSTRARVNKMAEDIGRPPPIMNAIGYGANPSILTAEEVSRFQAMSLAPASRISLVKAIRAGDRVELTDGAFAGHTGVVDEVDKKWATVKLKMFDTYPLIRINPKSLVAA
jgi:transcription antitermination factor NusG